MELNAVKGEVPVADGLHIFPGIPRRDNQLRRPGKSGKAPRMVKRGRKLLRQSFQKGTLLRPAYDFPRSVKGLGKVFQTGSEVHAQDLMPQAYAQHRGKAGQAVQKTEGGPVAGILHRSRTGRQDNLFPRLNRLFQFRGFIGNHARNGHSRHSDEFRKIPGEGIPVVDDPDVRLTHGAHMIE